MIYKEYDYVLYGQIQDFKAQYYNAFHERLNFTDTLKRLQTSGNIIHGLPQIPDFYEWNITNDSQLRELISQIPVDVNKALLMNTQIYDNVKQLQLDSEIFIVLESCYAAREFAAADYYTIIYVLSGKCTIHRKNSVHRLDLGGLCIIPPKIPFYVLTDPDDIVITIQSKGTNFQSNFSKLLSKENLLTSYFRKTLLEDYRDCKFFVLPPDKNIRGLIQNLFAEFLSEDSYSSIAFNNYLQTFYINIVRSIEPTYQYYFTKERTPAKILMPSILDYISSNFRTLTLQGLSDYFHYDSAYMSRLVQQLTGRSFKTILAELKIQKATELLTQTNLSIEIIADLAGYSSAEYFSYAFKKELSQTPTQFRKNNR